MKTPSKLFTTEEIASIEDTIRQVEEKTAAEIVPVVARVSGRYDRAEDLFAFVLSLLVLSCAWIALQGVAPSEGAWGSGAAVAVPLPIVLAILAITFLVGIGLASRFPSLRLPFIAKQEMQEEVERRALEAFQKLKIRTTENATGILIYVSLYEHMVHVEGDDTVAKKLSQSDFQSLCDTIISGFKSVCDGILSSGALLEEHFPLQSGDRNELFDTLHLFD